MSDDDNSSKAGRVPRSKENDYDTVRDSSILARAIEAGIRELLGIATG